MFQVIDRTTRELLTVYAVHKSGPHDDQTKFLVSRGGAWRWEWAARFTPAVVERPTASFRRGAVVASA